jgi:hypothetical protein
LKVIDAIPIWFRRILTIGILVVVIGFIGLGVLARCDTVDSPPSAKEAPWAIQTTSRIYYAKEFKLNGQTPEIRGYWTLNGNRYVYNEGVKDFDKAIYGKVAIVKRMVTK